ncbi:MAG: L,D-transpeptidase family protein [Nitrospiraceae bacterium]|nr:MAG: L,D-transpeptidase family protein [Nitrospiraceae bacterium]
MIGLSKTHTIQNRESLIDLARTYNVGYNEITAANAGIDPWVPDEGTDITIPTAWILPESSREGMVVNLAEMRLYYFFSVEEKNYVSTFPIGIGAEGFGSPTGEFIITAKVKDPVWRVPGNIRQEKPELPPYVLPGPENPLGGYWLQLSVNGYGIHGTNRPYGIGRRVSHGCIRLYPEDIEMLFSLVRPGIKVRIVEEPVKTDIIDNRVFIEVHQSEKEEDEELLTRAVENLGRKRLLEHVDTPSLIQAIKNATGLPAVISR